MRYATFSAGALALALTPASLGFDGSYHGPGLLPRPAVVRPVVSRPLTLSPATVLAVDNSPAVTLSNTLWR